MNSNKGFTLIELLVVIAIIGILASVVLTSLSGARDKANDAVIQSNLSQARAQAEILYATNGSYSNQATAVAVTAGNCSSSTPTGSLFTDASMAGTLAAAGKASGGTIATAQCVVGANATAYAISVPLKSNSAQSWCIDSLGNSRKVSSTANFSVAACGAAI